MSQLKKWWSSVPDNEKPALLTLLFIFLGISIFVSSITIGDALGKIFG